MSLTTIISFILIFGAIVFFHELGHFVFAKRAGILCREFAIGFGPKIVSIQRGETLYTIRLLPLGGFVRMAGEDPEFNPIQRGYRIGISLNDQKKVSGIYLTTSNQEPFDVMLEIENIDFENALTLSGYLIDSPDNLVTYEIDEHAFIFENGVSLQIAPTNRQFHSKKIGQRFLTIFAGPLMNFVLAVFLLLGALMINGIPTNEAKMGQIVPSGSAALAGIQKGDEVVSIDGTSIASWDDIVAIVQANPGKELTFRILRNGATLEIPVTPSSETINGKTIGKMGVYNPVEFNLLESFRRSVIGTVEISGAIFTGLSKLITGQFSFKDLSGPVGIYQYTDTVAQLGIGSLFQWAAILSINLGIMNLLPFPALDGGRLLFMLVELLRGKPVDRKMEGYVHLIGFALLITLMVAVTWNDIVRIFNS